MSSPQAISLSHRERGRGEGSHTKSPLPEEYREFARKLRGTQTDAESMVWMFLRGRRFAGLKFRRQHPVPPFVLDFYCEELRLAVELDGGQHNQDTDKARDDARGGCLRKSHVEMIRFWNDDVLMRTEAVLDALWNRVSSLKDPSSGPSGHLLPVGEGQ